MGYTTEFEGAVEIEPPLNEAEIAYLTRFGDTRRMRRKSGPYTVDDPLPPKPDRPIFGDQEWNRKVGQVETEDVLDFNHPPAGQPGLWCQWVPTLDGRFIEWDGSEKFYDAEVWMGYLIEHFLKPGAVAARSGDPQFAEFTFDHVVNGTIDAQGEDPDDRWKLVVKNNKVTTKHPTITWDET